MLSTIRPRWVKVTFMLSSKTPTLEVPQYQTWGGTCWRHRLETFSALLALCAGNSPATDEFPTQRPVTRSFVFFDLNLNKRLNKQSKPRRFETPLRPSWRHCKKKGNSDYRPGQNTIFLTCSLARRTIFKSLKEVKEMSLNLNGGMLYTPFALAFPAHFRLCYSILTPN